VPPENQAGMQQVAFEVQATDSSLAAVFGAGRRLGRAAGCRRCGGRRGRRRRRRCCRFVES
jgi:hypothetical protein